MREGPLLVEELALLDAQVLERGHVGHELNGGRGHGHKGARVEGLQVLEVGEGGEVAVAEQVA